MTAHLVDATLFFSPTSGGVRRYLLAKHDWLRQRTRLRHTILVPGPEDRGVAGGLVHFQSPRLRAGYRCPIDLPRLARTLAALEPDLLEAGDPYVVGWGVAAAAAQLAVPAVAFCHSDLVGLVAARAGALAGRVAAHYLRALYARFDLVLAPSRLVANRLGDAGVTGVRVQPLGVDATLFHPARRDAQLRPRLGLAPATRLLVFAGRLAPEKNIAELIATVERLGKPYHLLLIGGDAARRPSPRVTVLPYEPDPAAIAAKLAACDLLVHAGRAETFGLVALEAMAAGLPIVAYDGGALAEIVDDCVGRLAPASRRAHGLADAIADVFAADRAALGVAARARVLAEYTWDATLTRQVAGYCALLDRSPAPAEAATAPS